MSSAKDVNKEQAVFDPLMNPEALPEPVFIKEPEPVRPAAVEAATAAALGVDALPPVVTTEELFGDVDIVAQADAEAAAKEAAARKAAEEKAQQEEKKKAHAQAQQQKSTAARVTQAQLFGDEPVASEAPNFFADEEAAAARAEDASLPSAPAPAAAATAAAPSRGLFDDNDEESHAVDGIYVPSGGPGGAASDLFADADVNLEKSAVTGDLMQSLAHSDAVLEDTLSGLDKKLLQMDVKAQAVPDTSAAAAPTSGAPSAAAVKAAALFADDEDDGGLFSGGGGTSAAAGGDEDLFALVGGGGRGGGGAGGALDVTAAEGELASISQYLQTAGTASSGGLFD